MRACMVLIFQFLVQVLVGELQREGPRHLSDPTAHDWPPWGPLKLFIFASIWFEVRADVRAGMFLFWNFPAKVLVGELQRDGPRPLPDRTAHYWPPWGPFKLFIFASIWSEVRADVRAGMFFFWNFPAKVLVGELQREGHRPLSDPIAHWKPPWGPLNIYILFQFGLR